jgi:hypothetical protein
LALKVLEKVARYEGMLGKQDPGVSEEDRKSCSNLMAEYYVLRTAVVRITLGQ